MNQDPPPYGPHPADSAASFNDLTARVEHRLDTPSLPTVELVAVDDHEVLVLVGTEHQPDTFLSFTPHQWEAFTDRVAAGHYSLDALR